MNAPSPVSVSLTCSFRIAELFRIFDANEDGHVNIDEVRRMFAAVDMMKSRTHEQEVSYSIVCGSCVRHECFLQRADNFFNTVDSDRDGKLLRNEFLMQAKRDPAIMKVSSSDSSRYSAY
jgi:Ca2+-binding EF-hand superfamily protein